MSPDVEGTLPPGEVGNDPRTGTKFMDQYNLAVSKNYDGNPNPFVETLGPSSIVKDES